MNGYIYWYALRIYMYNCSRNEHEEIPAAIALADASAHVNAPSGGNEILHAVAHAVAFALATATAPQGVTTETET